ncbi:hypothetical protein BGX27_003472 [Mortierella sp. AM989]|nr:hypothetical protein BGX27_003472 [Mortierella sp. AM989]
MESKLSWILKQAAFDVEAFTKEFDYDTEKSVLSDIQELTKCRRMSQATRKAIERDLDLWLLFDHGTFWQEQKKNVTAKKALSITQAALIGTASNLVPDTLDQVSNEPTVTSQAPLPQPTPLLQPTAVEDQISTTPIGSPLLSSLRMNGPRLYKTKDNTLILEDLLTDTLASNLTAGATPAKSSAPALAVVEPADTSDEHADISDESDESEELLEREREELLRSVDESDHPTCDWEVDGVCAACRFMDYRRTCINALTVGEIKKTDIADILAIIGVLAPHMPTSRMQEFFSAEQLKVISRPGSELPDINIEDEMIMKAVRLYLKKKGDEAEVPSVGGNKKIRIMLETLLEYLPLKTNNKISESTFTVKYVGPIVQAFIDSDEVASDFPNTNSTTQIQQNMKADRPDIRAKALEREIMWGEVTGPIQARCNAKNIWDTFKLARYGKAFIIAGNDFAPLVQVIDNQGSYMRLYLKTRGVMILEEIGTFVIPTRKEMVPALVATLPTLELLKEHLKKLTNGGKVNQLKRSWGHSDDKIQKKRLL